MVFLIPLSLHVAVSHFFSLSTAWGAISVNNIKNMLENVHIVLFFSPNVKLRNRCVLCSLDICLHLSLICICFKLSSDR